MTRTTPGQHQDNTRTTLGQDTNKTKTRYKQDANKIETRQQYNLPRARCARPPRSLRSRIPTRSLRSRVRWLGGAPQAATPLRRRARRRKRRPMRRRVYGGASYACPPNPLACSLRAYFVRRAGGLLRAPTFPGYFVRPGCFCAPLFRLRSLYRASPEGLLCRAASPAGFPPPAVLVALFGRCRRLSPLVLPFRRSIPPRAGSTLPPRAIANAFFSQYPRKKKAC